MSDSATKQTHLLSGLTIRNLLFIAAALIMLLWPISTRLFASIVSCSGCSCVHDVTDGPAECSAFATCEPEDTGIVGEISSHFLCPSGSSPVLNQASTSGEIGGFGIFSQATSTSIFFNQTCETASVLEQCDGTTFPTDSGLDPTCCDTPPPPPPGGGGGGECLTDTDCPPGQICQDGLDGPVCQDGEQTMNMERLPSPAVSPRAKRGVISVASAESRRQAPKTSHASLKR